MIHKTPGQLPPFGLLVDDMPANRAQVADYLGCNRRVLGRWVDGGNAPRMAVLSLFWVSRWGMSILDVDGRNLDAIRVRQLDAAEAENGNLRRRIERLENLGGFGSANDPLHTPPRAVRF